MKAIHVEFKELVAKGIIISTGPGSSTRTENFSYQEIPSFVRSYSTIRALPTSTFESLFIEGPLIDSWLYTDYIVDILWFKHVANKALFFKNGNPRLSYITEVITRLNSARKNWTATKEMCQKITNNWVRLQAFPEVIQKLSESFADSGQCTAHFPKVPTLVNTFIHWRRIDPECYRSVHIIFGSSDIQVSRASPLDFKIKHGDKTIYLCQEEYEYLLKKYIQCSQCKKWELPSEILFGCCLTCVGEFPRELLGYSERATSFFEPITSKSKYLPTLMGVELEYELIGSKLETLFSLHKHLKTHAIFKRDGSLRQGVEICTRPASINIHLEQFQKMFDDNTLMKLLAVESTCGMHVHIDRRKMTALTVGKLIKFMQDPENKSFIERIAGREENRFFRLATDLSVTSYHRGNASNERYLGINTQNTQTAELRIFKTPSDYPVFVKNMEFASALTSFVQPANSGIKNLTAPGFLKYIKDTRSTYKELYKFTKENF